MFKRRWRWLIGSLVVIALLATVAVGTAVAADNSSTTGVGQSFIDRLAQNLGISSTDLQNGLKTTEKQYVADALAKGTINQDQANKLNARIDQSNGVGPLRRFIERRQHRQDLARLATGNVVAETLNMTPQELHQALKSGTTLSQLVSQHGMTNDQFVNAVVANAKQKLDQQVANGRLTEQQETTMLNRLQTHLQKALENGSTTG